MSFSEVLKGLTEEVKGARGAAVVGMDGIVVEQVVSGDGADMQSVGAEYGNILKVAGKATSSLMLGSASEMTLATETTDVIIRKINDEYFMALLISHGGNFGKGRYALRKAAGRLEGEF